MDIKKLKKLIKSVPRLFKEDLPKDLHILNDCMLKYSPEYAVKYTILEHEASLIPYMDDEINLLGSMLRSVKLTELEVNDENIDAIIKNVFNEYNYNNLEGFFESLGAEFTKQKSTHNSFDFEYLTLKVKQNVGTDFLSSTAYGQVAFPFKNGFMIYNYEEPC